MTLLAFLQRKRLMAEARHTSCYLGPEHPDPRTRLWATYLRKMPEAKIDVIMAAMKWDLQMRKSARRKGNATSNS
jgi:hypothetical protein